MRKVMRTNSAMMRAVNIPIRTPIETAHHHEQAAEWVHRHHPQSGEEVEESKQHDRPTASQLENLDDRWCYESFPLEQVA